MTPHPGSIRNRSPGRIIAIHPDATIGVRV